MLPDSAAHVPQATRRRRRAPSFALAALAVVGAGWAQSASAAPPSAGREAVHGTRYAPPGRLDPDERARLRSDLRQHSIEERQHRLRELQGRRQGFEDERARIRPDDDRSRAAPIESRRVMPEPPGPMRSVAPPSPVASPPALPPALPPASPPASPAAAGAGAGPIQGPRAGGPGGPLWLDASQSTVEGGARTFDPRGADAARGDVAGPRAGARLTPEERMMLRRQLRAVQGEQAR